VGIGGYPELIDGGWVMAPRFALSGLNGEWEVENHGIVPDYDVDLDPAAVRQGHDPQLEKAVEVVLQLMKQHPTQQPCMVTKNLPSDDHKVFWLVFWISA
jgi:tricorn protease